MSQAAPGRRTLTASRAGALAVAAAYLVLATGYAIRTPLWQAPDEPAHFNYVAQVADETLAPPRIEPGDYPFLELEALKAARFPPGADISSLEYEDHQPPLYYYAASAPYRLLATPGARALGIRLFGVLLGFATLWVAWRVGRLVVPGEPAVALGAVSFVAFLPMNLTMTAAVNNDALATLVAGLVLLVSLRRASGQLRFTAFTAAAGALLGVAFLTKMTVYALGTVVLGAELLFRRGSGGRLRRNVGAGLAPVLIGVLIAAPWFVRNMATYGPDDPLALAAHDSVVVGQPRTADWLAEHGAGDTVERLLAFTFKSFWGVFGWMGVFLPEWIYGALAVATMGVLAGIVAAAVRHRQEGGVDLSHATLLGLAVAVVAGGFLVYNLSFVQHQGRYLFPALVPLALAFSTGVHEWGFRAAGPLGHSRQADRAGLAAVAGCAAMLGALAALSLERFVVPGLSPTP